MKGLYDVIVVGASVAGSTVAAELAAVGRSVLLLDRAVFPRDKPCDEASVASFAGRATAAYEGALDSAGVAAAPIETASTVRVIGPLGFAVDPVWRPGMMLVGDAAGFFDPITGEGMSAAILGARAAAVAVQEALERNDVGGTPFRRYAEARSAMLRDITRLGGIHLTGPGSALQGRAARGRSMLGG